MVGILFSERTSVVDAIASNETRSAVQLEKDYVLHTWQNRQGDWDGPTVVGGEGAWFWDEEGKRYLDLSSQAQCNHLGHQHPDMVAAIQKQAAELCFIHIAWGAKPRAELAKRLIETSGMEGGKVYYAQSGAGATEHAMKVARWITGRQKIISRYRSYHGATSNAIALSGDSRNWSTPGVPNIMHALPPYCYRCPFQLTYPGCNLRCASHIADIIEWEGPNNVAALVVEPIVGTNGVFAGPGDYWRELRDICNHYGVLLIADEVMTGFGRTGAWFGWQHWPDAAPDIMLLGKGLTAAYQPLGAVVLNQHCASFFGDHPLPTGLTYSGHPLCCAAGVAAIDLYERDGLIERSRKLGAWMHGQLREISTHHPSVGDLRGIGLFAGMELIVNEETRQPLSPWPHMHPALKRLKSEARDRGITLTTRGNLLIISPPLIIEKSDLAWGIAQVDELLDIIDEEYGTQSNGWRPERTHHIGFR
ncbi:MAG: aminotransferase class III-fold pyridoxal phosphate-dependent enzyme [Caldilineae bacterium]|nr:aminotransferase class III-fold pyridoxal phosphate-dependent enzyme [Anaerolineae bacterium]MCB0198891.1 aminotransferase class III-fold pyridoxal phosphate-dependent enzyme [Anaerolineae bacterium]MCB0203420.1 aminotransferase class III-fold pyridoxal phosphate-dependent enzyme [Anaerolineae bacterium]MCB0254165.1 aminotransferase class III-fold pyridoxal phosphate-dependent enzyme [Anaerolineae bacterium]MCB9153305.1 aminotransferase class III-fold pyridoxal phosphate-dependent enzyme [Ca